MDEASGPGQYPPLLPSHPHHRCKEVDGYTDQPTHVSRGLPHSPLEFSPWDSAFNFNFYYFAGFESLSLYTCSYQTSQDIWLMGRRILQCVSPQSYSSRFWLWFPPGPICQAWVTPGNMSKVVELEDVRSLQEPANSLLGPAAQCAGGEVGERDGRKKGC